MRSIIRFFDNLSRGFEWELFALALLILLIPVMINAPQKPILPVPFGGKLQLSELGFFILLTVWLIKFLKRKIPFVFSFMYVPILIYILVSCVSLINAGNLTGGIIELLGMLYLAALFITLINVISNKDRFYFAIKMWLIASAVVSVLGVLGVLIGYVFHIKTFLVKEYSSFPFIGHLYRACSTFIPSSKLLNSYLTIASAFAFLSFILSRDKRMKLFWLASLLLYLIAFIFTFARGWFGLAVCFSLILVKINDLSMGARIFKRLLLILTVSLGVFTIFVSLCEIDDLNFKKYYDRSSSIKGYSCLTNPEMGLLRMDINFALIQSDYLILKKTALEMFKENPFLGIGVGNFQDKIIDFKNKGKLPHDYQVLEPHSTIFGQAAETGILGVAALIFLWAYFLKRLLRIYKLATVYKDKLVIWTIFSIAIAFILQGIDIDIMNFRFVWFVFALGISSSCLLAFKEGCQY